MKRKIRISNRGATPTIENERVPEKEELGALLMYGDERTGAAICQVAQSGLRLQVLGNDKGDDGLTIEDLPELRIREDHAEFARIPTMIVVRPSLSKANHKYFTFLPKEGCDRLAACLNKRLSEGEKFTSKTPVIAMDQMLLAIPKKVKIRVNAILTHFKNEFYIGHSPYLFWVEWFVSARRI